jgi:electron transfer flavoprotein alpha/beta subunit
MNAVVCVAAPLPHRACHAALAMALRLGDDVNLTFLTASHDPKSPVLETLARLGPQRVVHLCDPAFEVADAFGLGMALATAIRHLQAHVVFAGSAGDKHGFGLVPAAVAHHWNAHVLSGVEEASWTASTGELMAVTRAGGKKLRLAFMSPVVLAVPAPKLGTIDLATTSTDVPVETMSLAKLDLKPSHLDFGYDRLSSTGPATARSENLNSIDELVSYWLTPVKPR